MKSACAENQFASAVRAEFASGMPSSTELMKLPVAERLALIEQLWASIPEDSLPVEPHAVQEAQARWAELKRDPALGISFEEIKKRLG